MIRGLILAITLLAATSAEAEQRRYDLKGVREMKYQGIFEDTTARCEIDRRAWNTSIDFVANQSSKLKFWREVDHMAQEQTRHDRVMALEVDLGDVESKRRWDQEWDKLTKFGSMPNLYFDLISIDVKNGCVGVIRATVDATLKPSEMISTGTLVRIPSVTIWSNTVTLSAPFQGFSSFAIQSSEQIMKEFVNDWTASQNLP